MGVGDTIKLNLDPDYFPLMEGYKLTYRHTSTEFEGTETVEIVLTDLRAFRDDAQATAVLTRTRDGKPGQQENYAVRKTARQVTAEGGVLKLRRMEFPLPLVPGKKWLEEPNVSEIAALDAPIEVPAGMFRRCLRVNTLLAGGDGGSTIRYYAPGIGYVYEEYSGEDWGSRVELVSFHVPPIRRA
ncbi:MAG: hypothetical protein NTX64_13460 [Elusimicrobia bacterium]|nr:hypothetical protein [Elusimicrobiota bacterium]